MAATPDLERPVLLAVDGVDGSGKTTFAESLADAFRETGRSAFVVHLDYFLNDRSTRYRLGRSSPEGYLQDTYNLDTFRALILEPLSAEGDRRIVPRAFDHRTDTPIEDVPFRIPSRCVVIVEGMFLHREELRRHWDVSVFLDVPFPVSVRRTAERDGGDPDPQSGSQRRYVEGQRIYLSTCRPADRATFVIDNS